MHLPTLGKIMSDSKYFATTKKGETYELRQDLTSNKSDRKKEALKKIIASMTVGKDVSSLFTEVLNCIQTNDLEMKKLVYLYIMNYARSQPTQAILAVNTFQNDASDPNPLIRALAIRTMGCIRVENIMEYLCEPLRRALDDVEPYVCKTAATCVAKLYDMDPQMVRDHGLLALLQNLLTNSNPVVVANAIEALYEIDQFSEKPVLIITKSMLPRILTSIEECTEWGQVGILNALITYLPEDANDANQICLRLTPRLHHANSAIVLSTIKIMIHCMKYITNNKIVSRLCSLMSHPLATLLSKQPEVQYVALRNINIIIQKYPETLRNEYHVFFCKYNDVLYVKMEKLEIMVMLSNEKNVDQVLIELREYSQEVDIEFARKAVRAIGRLAIKMTSIVDRCAQVLTDIIDNRVAYLVEEAAVVVRDLFRKFPNKFPNMVTLLASNFELLADPEAKASMIWMIGEYTELISNAADLLGYFLEYYPDENFRVQQQLLTATMKTFLKLSDKQPSVTKMLNDVLSIATQQTENPDLRERAFFYSRLLSIDSNTAKQIILGEKPSISYSNRYYNAKTLDMLLSNISTLASIYHKAPDTFVPKYVDRSQLQKGYLYMDEKHDHLNEYTSTTPSDLESTSNLISTLILDPQPSSSQSSPASLINDICKVQVPFANKRILERLCVLDSSSGKGLAIHADFLCQPTGQITLELGFVNRIGQVRLLQPSLIQFKPNYFRLKPQHSTLPLTYISPNESITCSVICTSTNSDADYAEHMEVAIKLDTDIFILFVPIPLYLPFIENNAMTRREYLSIWRQNEQENYYTFEKNQLFSSERQDIVERLHNYNVAEVSQVRASGNNDLTLYMAAKFSTGTTFLFEFVFGQTLTMCTKASDQHLVPYMIRSIAHLLSLKSN